MEPAGLFALVAVAGAIAFVIKGWDVRLVLLVAALLIAVVVETSAAFGVGGAPGAVPAVVREFLATFSNEKFVVPICCAMGFAYVLKHTGCERHLVLLLVRPLRSVRGLMVPGVVLVGFVVNIPLISQTSTAVCLGAVVVPLMRAAGYSMATIGACLLLGASVGGELLNPGAPELLTVERLTNVPTAEQANRYLAPIVFVQLGVSMLVLWLLSRWWEHGAGEELPRTADVSGASERPTPPGPPSLKGRGEEASLRDAGKEESASAPTSASEQDSPLPFRGGGPGGVGSERVSLAKALVPLVPLVLLFAAAPPFSAVSVPDEWVIARLPDGARNPAYNSRLVGFAMLIGVLVAAAVARDKARDCVKEFFAGAGYGFANIVSLIVIASCFGKAIEAAGLARALGALIARAPDLLQPLAALVPMAFAAVCGSGMASTQSLYGFFHGPAVELGVDPVGVGALVSLGSAAGRTMSPVAAVVLMCATLTGTNPFTLAKRVAGPLLAGLAVVLALRLGGIL